MPPSRWTLTYTSCDEYICEQIWFIKLLDAAGLAISKKHGADFGQQKMAGSLSAIVVPVSCGLLIDTISEKLGAGTTFRVETVNVNLNCRFIFRLHRLFDRILHKCRICCDSDAHNLQPGNRRSKEQAINNFYSQKRYWNDRCRRLPCCWNLRGCLWVVSKSFRFGRFFE